MNERMFIYARRRAGVKEFFVHVLFKVLREPARLKRAVPKAEAGYSEGPRGADGFWRPTGPRMIVS
jgi:hypothetical protein